MLQVPQEQVKETRVGAFAKTDAGRCRRGGGGEGSVAPTRARARLAIGHHHGEADVLSPLLEAGSMTNNSELILKKVSCISLPWEKTTFVNDRTPLSEGEYFRSHLHCVIHIIPSLIHSSNTLEPRPRIRLKRPRGEWVFCHWTMSGAAQGVGTGR